MIEKLQIYKDTYLLTGKLYDAMPQMERYHRFSIGSRMLDTALDLFKWITLANKARGEKRIEALDGFLLDFELLRTHIRICNDHKLIKLTTLVEFFTIIDSISKQLSAWRAATTRTQ